MLDLKTLKSKTATDYPEMTRVRSSMRRDDRETTPNGYKLVFEKISLQWGLIFVEDQIAIPYDSRRNLLGHLTLWPIRSYKDDN